MFLNSFQLRAARSALNVGVREIGSMIEVNRTSVSLWENRKNFEPIKTSQDNNNILVTFFERQAIMFPNERSISLAIDVSEQSNLLSRFQIRIARVAMHLTQSQLSQFTEIPLSLLNYLESRQNTTYIGSTPKEIDESILRNFFEKNGILFPKNFYVYLEKDPRELINNY